MFLFGITFRMDIKSYRLGCKTFLVGQTDRSQILSYRNSSLAVLVSKLGSCSVKLKILDQTVL